jgi:hypothetical protein
MAMSRELVFDATSLARVGLHLNVGDGENRRVVRT